MNVVMIIGNATKDPELRYSTGENPTAICRFSIANNEGYGERKETNFVNIVVFGKQAENCEKYVKKGSKVAVLGRLKTGSYEKNGQRIYTTDVIANVVEFLSGNKQEEKIEWKDTETPPKGFAKLDDDSIPF